MGPYDPSVKNHITSVSLVALLALAGQALAQDQATPPKAPEPTPAPAPQAPAAPAEAAPIAPPETKPVAAAPPSTSASFQNKDEVQRWIETYYQSPEPHRVLDAFRTLVRENAFASGNKDFVAWSKSSA